MKKKTGLIEFCHTHTHMQVRSLSDLQPSTFEWFQRSNRIRAWAVSYINFIDLDPVQHREVGVGLGLRVGGEVRLGGGR